nr:response regulator [Pseudomonadota bacterium]
MGIKTALVVDDSRVARLTLSKLLKERGIDVTQAGSAREALEHLKHHRPDVVFMDFMMPDMDGLEATRHISENPVTAQIPVIIC